MALQTLTGSQAGLTVNDIWIIIADDWGYNSNNTRMKNIVMRRVNRAIRDIANHDPKWRILRVVGADVHLSAGQSQYDTRDLVVNGGFGWDTCVEVQQIVMTDNDNRPLEKLTVEQWRERSHQLDIQGIPTAWVAIDQRRVIIYPTPIADADGIGDYLAELPSLSDFGGQLEWPRHWDEAIMRGVEYHTAKTRLRENPQAVAPYRVAFDAAMTDMTVWEKTQEVRPFQAVVTRKLRSRKWIPRDNSTDLRFYR